MKILGPDNLPAQLARHASEMYARNLLNLMNLLITSEDEQVGLKDFSEDEVTQAALMTHDGKVVDKTAKTASTA